MNPGEQEQQGLQYRAAPVCNVISFVTPFVGFACGVVAAIFAPHFQWWERGFLVWLGFGVAGLLSGIIAVVRAERLWGLTLAGLTLNAGLVFLLGAWFIDNGALDFEKPVPLVPVRQAQPEKDELEAKP